MSGKILFILNDPPYGTERSYNVLRLAGALAKRGDGQVRVLLIGDAVGCAMANQKLPDGYYHLDRMIGTCARHGADIGCCGTCMDARGITEDMLTKRNPPLHARGTGRLDAVGRPGHHLLTAISRRRPPHNSGSGDLRKGDQAAARP